MIHVYFARFDPAAPESSFRIHLPDCVTSKISKYRRARDRLSRLVSALLIQKGLRKLRPELADLTTLSTDKYGRPFAGFGIDFNVSHSGEYAVVALVNSGRVGIDIERVQPVALEDFRNQFDESQWQAINTAPRNYEKFFELWTIKESASKVDGRGLGIPFAEIRIEDETAIFSDNRWYYKRIDVGDGDYICHVASDEPITVVESLRVDIAPTPSGR